MPIAEIVRQLEEQYHLCHHEEDHPGLPDLADSELTEILEEMVREVYAAQGTDGTINQRMAQYFANTFWKGAVSGFGSDLDQLDYNSPDYNMLKALKENVWHFSAAKNYHQLRALTDALLNDQGELRSFDEFKIAAKQINDQFVKNWMKTEYDLAVSGSQMAGKWVDIVANADTLPLIQFDVVMDGGTTDICKSLHLVTVPITHVLVQTCYPPNHFRCRTTVRQLASGAITPDNKIVVPEIPDMFRTNLAQTGLIFPEGHAYFVDLPPSVRNQFTP